MFDENEFDEDIFDDNSDDGNYNTYDFDEEEYDPDLMYVTLHVNARMQPKMRTELEEKINRLLDKAAIGETEGSKTIFSDTAEPLSCEIKIVLDETLDEFYDRLTDMIEKCELPKGSYLLNDGEKTPVGRLEGMAVYLDANAFPSETYREYDINFLANELKTILGKDQKISGLLPAKSRTAFYFYGDDFAVMSEKIKGFIEENPLCRNCRVEKIA